MMHNSRSREGNPGPARVQSPPLHSEGVIRKGLFTVVSPDGAILRIPPENVFMEMDDYGSSYRISMKIPYSQVKDLERTFGRTF
jgi:hypothetical protein